MSEKFRLIRLPIALLVIFFLGKLIGSFAGMPYEVGAQIFGMVPLTIHLCLVWGALGKSVYRLSLGSAVMLGVLIALVAQLLIFGGTAFSYLAGVQTHFNDPMAIIRESRSVGFEEAMVARAIGLVVNLILGAIGALIGYGLAALVVRPSQA